MLYIDLSISLLLFVTGIIYIMRKQDRKNVWIIILAFIFYPISIFMYYFPDINMTLFGSTTVRDVVIYPFVKILIIFALVSYLAVEKKKKS
ncbi:MAG: hypothetical protein KAJ15_08875 [Spirochaetes bacterium]|nr:hypothetical protein [Spirochaetota bacterium]